MIKTILVIALLAILFLFVTRNLGAISTGRVAYEQVYPGTTYVSGFHG